MDPMFLNAQPGAAPSATEMAACTAGLEVAGVAVGAPAAPAPAVAAAVRWLTEAKRSADYMLEFPFAIGEPAVELEVRTIVIRRMTGGQVSALIDRMRAEPEVSHRWPMYFVATPAGEVPVSDDIWDALDDDDKFALTEIADGFLPVRFKSRSPAPSEPAAS